MSCCLWLDVTTSCLGSLLFPSPGGGKRKDPGNEDPDFTVYVN